MNPLIIKMKVIFVDLFTNVYTWIAAISTWQEDLDWGVKIAVGISAIILSWVTISEKTNKKK